VYFESRRLRVNAFVDRHFSLAGSLALHRKALGWDVLRAPLNVALAVPYIGAKLMASIAGRLRAKRLSRFLASRRILLETAVGQEIEWLIVAELLELPFRQECRGACSSAPASIRACMKPLLVTSSAWSGSHSRQSKVCLLILCQPDFRCGLGRSEPLQRRTCERMAKHSIVPIPKTIRELHCRLSH
jgi:hypothetical protein